MDPHDTQISPLERIFAQGRFSPKFRKNPRFKGDAPFIAYDDVLAGQCIIREGDDKTIMSLYANKKNRIIAEYPNLEALVQDGWELD